MDTTSLIREHREELSPAERRVADVVVTDPQLVAFGTVAEVAGRAGTSGATVVRLAGRLGLHGFSDLQERVQHELSHQIHRAAARIHQPPHEDLLGHTVAVASAGLTASLAGIDRDRFDDAVEVLADQSQHVFVIAAEASRGIAQQFSNELAMLRRDVTQVEGSPVAVHQTLADVVDGDVVVATDLPRYDRWLLDATAFATNRGARLIALSDSPLSPLAAQAEWAFSVSAQGTGPFDSHVVSLAVFEALVSGVAALLQGPAADHLERIETAWSSGDVLADD